MKGICKAPDSARRLSDPHYNSYQDVNGDCIPDLLLTTFNEATNATTLEVYIQVYDPDYQEYRFCMVYEQDMGDRYTSPNIVDLDYDGSVDIVLFDTYINEYKILFNQLHAKSPSFTGKLCHDPVTGDDI